MQNTRLISTKYIRPKLAKNIITRPRVINRLREALSYKLTIVRGEAGYGKSTIINLAFDDKFCRTVWLHLSEYEISPIAFLDGIIHALSVVFPNLLANQSEFISWDERNGAPDESLILEGLISDIIENITEEAVIILEDYHLVSQSEGIAKIVGQLVNELPENMHILISSRGKPYVPGLPLMRGKRQVLDVGEEDLAFKPDEIQALFRTSYGLEIDLHKAQLLADHTEGWIMAIQMFGQTLQKGVPWDDVFNEMPQQMEELFEYLAREYLAKQPQSIRSFLIFTSYLRLMNAEDCNHILGLQNSNEILRNLENNGLFIFRIGNGYYRYHQLFKEFLQKRIQNESSQLAQFHETAASYYKKKGIYDLSIEHFLAGRKYLAAAALIREIFTDLLGAGRYTELEKWLDEIPVESLDNVPELYLCWGDICRYKDDFAAAIKYYSAADRQFSSKGDIIGSYQTAKGFAMVYIDSVQSAHAEKYLNIATQILPNLPGDVVAIEKVRLNKLIAENTVNFGYGAKAAVLFEDINDHPFKDAGIEIEARMFLRQGRLINAKHILSRHDSSDKFVLRSYREPLLLLAFVNCLLGDVDEAIDNAEEVLVAKKNQKNSFLEMLAFNRLGHGEQLKFDHGVVPVEKYRQALAMGEKLGIERGKAEAMLGLCLFYGNRLELDLALRYGIEALNLIKKAKDDWMQGLLELAIAIAYCSSGAGYDAETWLKRAKDSFTTCGDCFLPVVCSLWQAKIALYLGKQEEFHNEVESLLINAQEKGLDFIFTKVTLFGLRDVQSIIPLLYAALPESRSAAYIRSLLSMLGEYVGSEYHPGYTLKIQTLGEFRVWRGTHEISLKEWQREKAKQLFQYFITNRNRICHKDKIIEDLWGSKGTDNDLRVAMNAMLSAIEPNRNPRTPPFFISKQEGIFRFKLSKSVELDVEAFEDKILNAEKLRVMSQTQSIKLYREAVALYKGEYLPDCIYEEWAEKVRDRLAIVFITATENLAQLLFEYGETREVIELCKKILDIDQCWEPAYRLLIQCYGQLNNKSLITRVYNQCRRTLQNELGVSPSTPTEELFMNIISKM